MVSTTYLLIGYCPNAGTKENNINIVNPIRIGVKLRITFEHLRCWREDLYVRPVGDAVRVCEFEITVFCLRIRSTQC